MTSEDIKHQLITNVEAWFSLRPRKPEGSLGRTAQDGHLDSHSAPELCRGGGCFVCFVFVFNIHRSDVMVVT